MSTTLVCISNDTDWNGSDGVIAIVQEDNLVASWCWYLSGLPTSPVSILTGVSHPRGN